MPSFLLVAGLLLAAGPQSLLQHPASLRTALSALFLLHYTYRSFVYPLRIQASKGVPFSVWLISLAFCTWNGFVQVRPSSSKGAGAKEKMAPGGAHAAERAALPAALGTRRGEKGRGEVQATRRLTAAFPLLPAGLLPGVPVGPRHAGGGVPPGAGGPGAAGESQANNQHRATTAPAPLCSP